jgi:SAM-dependent methyltransferase
VTPPAPPSASPEPGSLGTAGFASASDTYERGRPGYPDAFLSHLAAHWDLGPGRVAVDLAAGTGKLARQLQGAGARCVAVEPSASMRAECRRVSPGVAVVGGSAEHLPLASGCADLVTVAQAFHWFDPSPALHEMARVLRADGVLVLVWNERDLSVGWMGALDEIMRGAGDPPHAPTDELAATFDGDPHFGAFTLWRGSHQVDMTPEQVEDMVASRSYVRVLAEPERAAVLERVRALVRPMGQRLIVPYVTSAYCARAQPGRCRCAGTEEVPWSG